MSCLRPLDLDNEYAYIAPQDILTQKGNDSYYETTVDDTPTIPPIVVSPSPQDSQYLYGTENRKNMTSMPMGSAPTLPMSSSVPSIQPPAPPVNNVTYPDQTSTVATPVAQLKKADDNSGYLSFTNQATPKGGGLQSREDGASFDNKAYLDAGESDYMQSVLKP